MQGARGPEEPNKPLRGNTQLGANPQEILSIHAMHRHDGTILGGPQLFGPFFFKDLLNGHVYRLDCVNGVLVTTQVV